MISLYTDENVLEAITRGLRARGVDVLTARDDGRTQTDDSLILDRATELGRVLFSQDTDLLAIAVARQRAGNVDFSGVVYAHQHETVAILLLSSRAVIPAWLEARRPCSEAQTSRGEGVDDIRLERAQMVFLADSVPFLLSLPLLLRTLWLFRRSSEPCFANAS